MILSKQVPFNTEPKLTTSDVRVDPADTGYTHVRLPAQMAESMGLHAGRTYIAMLELRGKAPLRHCVA